MSVYENLVRPALFGLPPDLTHSIGHLALRPALPWRMLAAAAGFEVADPVLKTRFAGVDLAAPLASLRASTRTASSSARCPGLVSAS